MDLLNKIDLFVGFDMESIKEETEYQKFFAKKLKEAGVKSPAEFKSDDEKKEFFDMIKKEWKGSTNESWYVTEETEYQKFFAKKLKEAGVKSPAEFKSDDEKKEFFDMIKKEWKGSTNEEKKGKDEEEGDDESKEHEDAESDEEEKKEQEEGESDDEKKEHEDDESDDEEKKEKEEGDDDEEEEECKKK
jgi:hypothetical protein